MLAYVFLHRPADAAGHDVYLERLAAFHTALADAPSAGFLRSWVWRVGAGPLGAAFEDWYLVEDWTALGALDAAARDSAHRGVHDEVAPLSGEGAGAVYRLLGGEPGGPTARRVRLSKPSAVSDAEFEQALADVAASAVIWRRQMVLGLDSEFLVDVPVGPLPAGLNPEKASPLQLLYPR